MSPARFVLILLAGFAIPAGSAIAQFIDWDNGGLNNNWHNSANWNAVPPRIPNEDDTARIGNLAAAAGDAVTLGGNAVGAALELSAGADVDTNGHSLTIGDYIDAGSATTLSELIVRPANAVGALDYSVSAHEIALTNFNAQLTMLGGDVQLSGNILNTSSLTIGAGAKLIGYGSISFGGAGGIINGGSIFVRDPQPVLGEPPARTLELEFPGLVLVSNNLGVVDVGRNSTIRFSALFDSSLISANEVTVRGNSTVDLGIRTGLLKPSGTLIVNSGAVQVGLGMLPAVPAVIQGTDEFKLDDAEIVLDQSDEALTFDVFFRHVGGPVTSDGTILFNAGADISATAIYDTGGFGRLINGASSALNLANGADVDSPIINHGTLSIEAGSLGQATVDALTLTNTSSLEVNLQGVIPGQFDALTVDGNAILDGALVVSLDPAFSALPGNQFTILSTTFGIVSGQFDTEVLPTVGGLTFDVLYPNNHTVVLQVVNALLGDYNQDGVVDADDYIVWRKNLGSGTSLPNDDTPGVGPDDYNRWRIHFGQTAGSGAGVTTNAAVSEPATAMLLTFAAAGWYLRRTQSARKVPTTR